MKLLLFVSIIFGSTLIFGSVYAAQELISARIVYIEGEVEIRRQPDDRPRMQKIAFKTDDELRAGDTIMTGKKGKLVLGLSDGSQAVIAPQTTVVIKGLSQSPRTLFDIIRGKTRIQIEKLGGQPNPYRVNTPTAVIAVRGTIFDVLVEDDETQVLLHEGEVTVANYLLPDQPVFLRAGQMTRVLLERLPKLPVSFKVGRNDGTFQVDRRSAVGAPRPDFDRGGKPPISGKKPDFERGGRRSNERGPKSGPRNTGKRP